jgi:hypothetical protein
MRHTIHRLPAAAALLALGLSACNSAPERTEAVCTPPSGTNLERAIAQARADLSSGCERHFDGYWTALLEIGAGDPAPENRRDFSAFLEWSVDRGLLSRRQAKERYNRYFGVKYVSLLSDYSVCSRTCPNRSAVLHEMEAERADKELGLLKIADDRDAYRRADRLYNEMALVLEATCSACDAPAQ